MLLQTFNDSVTEIFIINFKGSILDPDFKPWGSNIHDDICIKVSCNLVSICNLDKDQEEVEEMM